MTTEPKRKTKIVDITGAPLVQVFIEVKHLLEGRLVSQTERIEFPLDESPQKQSSRVRCLQNRILSMTKRPYLVQPIVQ